MAVPLLYSEVLHCLGCPGSGGPGVLCAVAGDELTELPPRASAAAPG